MGISEKIKVCSKCLEELSIVNFYLDKTRGSVRSVCKKCTSILGREWREKNTSKKSKTDRIYRKSNLIKIKDYQKTYYKQNKEKFALASAKRKSTKSKSLVPMTEEELAYSEYLYWLSKDLKCVTGEVYHVDHIVPLQGKNVCGLHHPRNLQILPKDLNHAKSNLYSGSDSWTERLRKSGSVRDNDTM